MMSLGKKAAAQLTADNFDVALVNPRFVKPLDAELTESFGRAADVVVTIEDHTIVGGYGSAVLELFNEKRIGTPVVQVGWPDQFIEHATTVEDLRQRYGLTVEELVTKVRSEFRASPLLRESAVA